MKNARISKLISPQEREAFRAWGIFLMTLREKKKVGLKDMRAQFPGKATYRTQMWQRYKAMERGAIVYPVTMSECEAIAPPLGVTAQYLKSSYDDIMHRTAPLNPQRADPTGPGRKVSSSRVGRTVEVGDEITETLSDGTVRTFTAHRRFWYRFHEHFIYVVVDNPDFQVKVWRKKSN